MCCVINVTADVKLVRWSEVDWGFLKSFKDGTYEQELQITDFLKSLEFRFIKK